MERGEGLSIAIHKFMWIRKGLAVMEFGFSEEERLLQWAVSDFAKKELTEEELHTSSHVPQKIIEKMGT